MAVKKRTAKKRKLSSAGPQILKDLDLTDEELMGFLPADAPKWIRGVLWCQFEYDGTLADIAEHFRDRYEVTESVATKFPEPGPAEGVSVPTVALRPRGKYVAYVFYGMRGDVYEQTGSFQLETAFREMGTDWGSNRAVHERFKVLELLPLGARNVVERTE